MKKDNNIDELQDLALGCLCSKTIIHGESRVKWCYKTEPCVDGDSGWQFVGETDKDEDMFDNVMLVALNSVIEIEPALLTITDMPEGTQLYLVYGEDNHIRFFDMQTNQEIKSR